MHSLHLGFLNAPRSSEAFDENISKVKQIVAAPVTSVTMVVMVTGFWKLR
jgi:hypothetical protein